MFAKVIMPVDFDKIEIGMVVWAVNSHEQAPQSYIVESKTSSMNRYIWTDRGRHGIPAEHIIAAYFENWPLTD